MLDLAIAWAGLAVALVLSIVLLIAGGASPRSAGATRRRERGGALPGIALDVGDWLLGRFVPVFRRLRLTPNALSLVSLPTSAAAAVAVATGHFGVGGAILSVAFALDAWDGIVARETARASDAGEVVDATVDRYSDVVVMLGFLYYYRLDLVPWVLTALALVGTVLVSYTRAKGEAFGVVADIGLMQRHDRAVCLSLATTVAPAIAVLVGEPAPPRYYAVIAVMLLIAVASNVTAVRRARFIIEKLAGDRRRR
jgi:phosphatidylglycerophosphate synthase